LHNPNIRIQKITTVYIHVTADSLMVCLQVPNMEQGYRTQHTD